MIFCQRVLYAGKIHAYKVFYFGRRWNASIQCLDFKTLFTFNVLIFAEFFFFCRFPNKSHQMQGNRNSCLRNVGFILKHSCLLFSSTEESYSVFSTRSNYCKFLVTDGVHFLSVSLPFLKTPVSGSSFCKKFNVNLTVKS